MNDLDNMRYNFLGLNFSKHSMDEVLRELEHFIRTAKPHMISTITAELAVRANEDKDLKRIYNNADLLTIDSFIVYYAACLFRKSAARPVHATRLAFKFLPIMNQKEYSLYILGAKNDIVDRAVENIKQTYPKVKIAGFHHGYFDFNNDSEVVEDIKSKHPDVLFVGMSSPLKEIFISRNLKKMSVPVCLSVGGGVDIIAGKSRLAPLWVSKMGLEWVYRLVQEPGRMWKRYLVTNTKFVLLLMKEIFR